MIGYPVFRHRLWCGWHILSTRVLGRSSATSIVAAGFGGALLLMPAGTTWPSSGLADVLASPAILDWAKGSLGLMFTLWRRLGKTRSLI